MNLLQVNDPHLADSPPKYRKETYMEDILVKMEEISGIVRDTKTDVVIIVGDLFHTKAANRVSHRLVQEVMRILSSYGVDVFITPGNHDLSSGNLESIKKQPLGVVGKCPNVHVIVGNLTIQGVKFVFVPGTADVLGGLCEKVLLDTYDPGDVLVFHGSLEKKPAIYPHILPTSPALMNRYNVVLYGHIHDYHGVYTIGKTTFCNVGAISRGSLKESDMGRRPKVLSVRLSDSGVFSSSQEIVLQSAKAPVEVFKVVEAFRDKSKADGIDAFVKAMESSELAFVDITSIVASVKESDMEPAVKQEIISILEVVE